MACPLTPEIIINGRELVSVNIIPELQPNEEPTWLSNVKDIVSLVRNSQATNRKDRYKSVTHDRLYVGDIVLMKEMCNKPTSYPMAI